MVSISEEKIERISRSFRAFCLIIFLTVSLSYGCASPMALMAEKDDSLTKWKKAVVLLEGVADTVSHEQYSKLWRELGLKWKKGEISREEFDREIEKLERQRGFRQRRSLGTAIFMEHKKRRYLLTARHVVCDERIKDKEGRIFNLILRPLSPDELLKHGPEKLPSKLFVLGAGPSWLHPYTFSNPEQDLAIISLNRDMELMKDFVNSLIASGHKPISMTDIGEEPTSEGAEVFIVGYPYAVSTLKQVPPTVWRATVTSLPSFSFGRVSMLDDRLPFFKCDISAYPGASGSPVVENGKLVGIVSKQPLDPSEIVTKNGKKTALIALTRIPFSLVTKAKFIEQLLQIQIEKDKNSHYE